MEDTERTQGVERAYEAHSRDAYRLAYAILHDADSAMDATQEAFARAYERWDQYDAARPIRPWLLTIVGRVALDALRRQRSSRAGVAELAQDRASRGEHGDPAVDVGRRLLVDDSLAALPPRARAALVLRHYYGLTNAEIASALGGRTGSIGSLISRAQALLREQLRQEGVVAHDTASDDGPGSPANRERRSDRSAVNLKGGVE